MSNAAIATKPVNNGVNTEALIGARGAFDRDARSRRSSPSAAPATGSTAPRTATRSTATSASARSTPASRPSRSTPITPRCSPPRTARATPTEIVLAALASCLTGGVAAVAQHRGIQLRSVRATVEGDIDVRGILGMDPEVRNGFSAIRVTFEIDADATPETGPGAGRPVAEALGGVRHPDQPDQRRRCRSGTEAGSPREPEP